MLEYKQSERNTHKGPIMKNYEDGLLEAAAIVRSIADTDIADEIIEQIEKLRYKDYVNLGELVRKELGIPAQYGTRYADPDWNEEYKYSAAGLRVILNPSKDYHRYLIHKDDVGAFMYRVLKARTFE